MRVSLVIPLRNEEVSVTALFASIGGQIRSPDEIVVVDAGSTDGTLAVLRSLSPVAPLTLIACGDLYPGTARNVGVEAASYDWIAFTDGGVRLEPEWLDALCREATQAHADVVLGNYHPVCDSDFRRAAAVAYVPPLGESGRRGPSVASLLVRKAVLRAAGGFPDHRAAEDLILFEKLLRPPHRIAGTSQANIRWQIPASSAALFRRFALYSYHNLVAHQGYDWHRGVARLYVILGLAVGATGGLAGGLAAGWLLPGFFLARAVKAAWVKRRSFDFPTLRFGRVLRAGALLVVIDAATLTGFARWLVRSPPRN